MLRLRSTIAFGLSFATSLWIAVVVCAESANSSDEAAVRQAGKDYLQALQKGDLKALADFWTADGTWTDAAGKTVKIHEWLAKSAGDDKNSKSPQAVGPGAGQSLTKASDVVVRFVAPNVAEEEGTIDGAAGDADGGKGHYVAIWIKQDGRWKLSNVHEMHYGVEPGGSSLASLDIFAGQWSGTANQSTIKVAATWDATKKYMRREFSIASGAASLAGTQEIGWDPVSRQIKSWTFFTDGSRGEGLWEMEGNVWMVASTRILPDGKTSTSTQVYEFPDRNTMSWKTIRGTVDGQPTDDFEVVFKRTSAAK